MQTQQVAQSDRLENAFDIAFGTSFRVSRFGFIGVGKIVFQEDEIVIVGPKKIDFFYKSLITILFAFSAFGFIYERFFIATTFVYPLFVFCFLFVMGVVERMFARFLPRIEITIDYAETRVKKKGSGHIVLLYKKDASSDEKLPIVFRVKKREDIQRIQNLMQQRGIVEVS